MTESLSLAAAHEILIELILSRADTLIAALDRRLGGQLDEILHHPLFQ